ncbi:ABC transporter permease [Desulfovibrio aerotolerans]|uniref:ABC transporter permease n=1 Tax=Solidesulfovibrio aerotolerans TaxID=295255 RepID=A0A7C9JBJ1_9BACT|nr:ABC transporter permease [Solidesulfovibrio aerotolerans]MYL85158.1 ABC transporter permease [Solidesulfovibrio aerotolerans]
MIKDLVLGFIRWPMWAVLAWEDICQRYRRNILGPFWLTVSTGVSTSAMALIFTKIFHIENDIFIPYLTAGMIAWSFISSSVIESINVFIQSKPIMMSIQLPLSFHVYRLVLKNFIIFLHISVIYFLVTIFFPVELNVYTWMVIPGVIMNLVLFYFFAIPVGMVCARFRDVAQIIMSILAICSYVTPLFWMPDMIGDNAWLLNYNPLYSCLVIIRDPLLGKMPTLFAYEVAGGLAFVLFLLSCFTYKKYMSRLIFWL